MNISIFHKSALYWTLSVVILLALVGGFWYMNVFLSVSQQAEENGVTLIAADASEEVEIVLAGEIPAEPERVEENVLPEEKELPVLPNTAVKNANLKGEISLEEQLTNIEIAENATTSALEDDEEIEIIFECETGDEITGDRIL